MRFCFIRHFDLIYFILHQSLDGQHSCISCRKLGTNSPLEQQFFNFSFSQSVNYISIGANETKNYVEDLSNLKVGVVGNHTSLMLSRNKKYVHLVDSLISLKINFLWTFHLLGLKNDILIIKKYLPISSIYSIVKLSI